MGNLNCSSHTTADPLAAKPLGEDIVRCNSPASAEKKKDDLLRVSTPETLPLSAPLSPGPPSAPTKKRKPKKPCDVPPASAASPNLTPLKKTKPSTPRRSAATQDVAAPTKRTSWTPTSLSPKLFPMGLASLDNLDNQADLELKHEHPKHPTPTIKRCPRSSLPPRRASIFQVSPVGLALLNEDMSESEVDAPLITARRKSSNRRSFMMGESGNILLEDNLSDSDEEEKEQSRRKKRTSFFRGSSKSPPKSLLPILEEDAAEEEEDIARQGLFNRIMSKRKSTIGNQQETPSRTTAPSKLKESALLEKPESAPTLPAHKRSSIMTASLTQPKRSSLFDTPLHKRNRTNYTPMDVNKALKVVPKTKWKAESINFSGRFDCQKMGRWEEIQGKKIDKGIKKFKEHPEKYVAITFHRNMRFAHNVKKNTYTLIHREGTAPITPLDVDAKGPVTLMTQRYQHLASFPNNELPREARDPYTYDLEFDGAKLPPPLLPGRGMGVGDTPNLKIIGDIDPSDITQGEVGDCWLLSAISALAEFDGAVKRLFRKTKHLDYMPMDGPNKYTVTLYDLTTWEEVDIVIDESLSAHPTRPNTLLGAQISEDGELWVAYLEKAFIVHCGGGWDGIEGGHATHAWSMMTGCKEQYFIRRNYRTGKYHISAKYDMFTKKWKQLYNLPRHEDTAGLEPVPWPEVGGGGAMGLEVTADALFLKMHAWDQENYIIGASSKGTLQEDMAAGLLQNHSYSVIDAYHNVAGTDIDLFKIRNPWGHTEIEDGLFHDNGKGWEIYPQIKEELKPVVADDGIFYLTKNEFFDFFDHIYLSASNMTEFKED